MGFSCVYLPDDLKHTLLSQHYVLENDFGYGIGGQKVYSKGTRSLWLPQFSSGVNQRSCPFHDLLQQSARLMFEDDSPGNSVYYFTASYIHSANMDLVWISE